MNTRYKNLNLIFELVKKGDIVVGCHLLALPALHPGFAGALSTEFVTNRLLPGTVLAPPQVALTVLAAEKSVG